MRYREFRTRDKRPWDHPTAYRKLLCAPLLSTFNPVWEREKEYKLEEEDKKHPQDINNPKAAVS